MGTSPRRLRRLIITLLTAAALAVPVVSAPVALAANPGVTVAGGNGFGAALNQLASPRVVFVDGVGNVYVADTGSHRVQVWAPGATAGVTVAGGNGNGAALNQLASPRGVFVDGVGNVYVADTVNHRVQVWAPGATAGVTVAGGNGFGAALNQLAFPRVVFVDGVGNVYVADTGNHRVQVWAPGATAGVTVAGGNGNGAALNQLAFPIGVFVDGVGNVYVADRDNHRVQVWAPGATAGVTVAGGNGFGAALNQLAFPQGVFVDGVGNVYVADRVNHRVQVWAPGATAGVTVAGGNGQGAALNQLANPTGVFVDGVGNVYVSDTSNHRIQKFGPGLLIAEGTTGEDPGVVLRDYPFTAAPTATWPGGQQLFDSELQVTNFANPGVNILRGLDADGQPPFVPGTNPLNAAVAIPMTAQIGGAGGGNIVPTLFCKWELPDMDPALPNVPFSQWSDVPNNSWSVAEHLAGVSQNNTPLDEADDFPISLNPWDDDDLRPLVPGAVAPVQDFPCKFGAGALPEYADGATSVIQVRANVADGAPNFVGPGGNERVIELWAAVGPVGTVNDVYWKVFHPDGSIKTQVHGVGVDGCDFDELGAQSGNPALTPASMWWAANGTGQIDNAAITNDGSNGQTGLVAACQQDQLRFWYGTFTLSKHQPCGEYKVEVTANNFGAEASLTNFLDVICFHELAVDFTEVAFGQIEAFPQTSYKLGDLFFDPAGNSASPTIKNLGSGGMEIGVEFYTMYEDNTPGPKYIDEFDAKLGITPSQLQEIGSNDAGAIAGLGADGTWLAVDSPDGLGAQAAVAWFGTSDWQTVCSNEVAKLDVSVHPSAQSGSGAFTGGIKIYARADTATDNVNNTLVNVNDVTIGHPNINPDNGGWVPPPNAPAPLYTCNNDNGFWGGYHNVGENLVRNGNGYNGVPFGAAFDDKYYNPANNGTVDLSTEAGSSNQRSIHNQ